MVVLRRRWRAGVAAAIAVAAGALPALAEGADSGDSGAFVDLQRSNARKLEYLRFATRTFAPRDPVNVIAHLERSRVDRGYRPAGVVPIHAWDRLLSRMEDLVDTRDFDALYLLHIVFGYADHPMLAPGLAAKVDRALLDFKYWYTEPTAPGKVDASYY
jgi:hypothetical protein